MTPLEQVLALVEKLVQSRTCGLLYVEGEARKSLGDLAPALARALELLTEDHIYDSGVPCRDCRKLDAVNAILAEALKGDK